MLTLIRLPAVDVFRFAQNSTCLPLGLAYIAGALESKGIDISVIDSVGEAPKKFTRCYKGFLIGLTPEDIVERIAPDSDIIGISCIFTHEWPILVHLADLIKQKFPHATIVVGGEHVTSMPEFCLLTSKVDVIVLGEGEDTMCEVVDRLRNGGDLSKVSGIGYRDKSRVVVNPRRPRATEIDDIPYPAWDHFKIHAYTDGGYVGGLETSDLTIPILATRGCPYQCTYCSSANMWTPKWVPRDPKKVVDEIEFYHRKYGAKSFPFQDLTAIIKREWIIDFCEEMLRRNLDVSWQMTTGTRSEAIDLEVAQLLKKTNMINMAYAPESGSDTTRKLIKKKMKRENLMRSVYAASEAGLNVTAFIVIGFPHDTPELVEENLPFVDEIATAGVTDLGIGFYMALPGTELFNSLQDDGAITLDRAYFRHILSQQMLNPSQSYCKNLSVFDLFLWKLRIFRSFYSAKRANKVRGNFARSIGRGISGLVLKKHSSRLQTVFRLALLNGTRQVRVFFKRPWLPRASERALFATFDPVFQQIRKQKLERGVSLPSPIDTTELHKTSVVNKLKSEHEATIAFRIDGAQIALEEAVTK